MTSLLVDFVGQISLAAAAATPKSTDSVVIAMSQNQNIMGAVKNIGMALVLIGFFFRISVATLEMNLAGKPPAYLLIVLDCVVSTMFISLFMQDIAVFIWKLCHSLGAQIAQNITYEDLLNRLKAANEANWNAVTKSTSPSDFIDNIFQAIGGKIFGAIYRWYASACFVLIDIVTYFFNNLQVVMFNISYVFAPIIVGIGSFGDFGIGGKVAAIRHWVDVSAWSITMGVIVFTYSNFMGTKFDDIAKHTPKVIQMPSDLHLNTGNYDTMGNPAPAPNTNFKAPSTPPTMSASTITSSDYGFLSQTIFILGCILAVPSITSTMIGGAGASLASAGRSFTGILAGATGAAIHASTGGTSKAAEVGAKAAVGGAKAVANAGNDKGSG